jgi:aspartyl-tRNA(Asn)/glutamyl-tRNA(Gln) amidotransferase subunit C
MAVSEEDVRHIASLARLGLEPDRVALLASELNGILAHMDTLAAADTTSAHADTSTAPGMPLRGDGGTPLALAREREAFAPQMEGGFFLVPRLSTHEDSGDGA